MNNQIIKLPPKPPRYTTMKPTGIVGPVSATFSTPPSSFSIGVQPPRNQFAPSSAIPLMGSTQAMAGPSTGSFQINRPAQTTSQNARTVANSNPFSRPINNLGLSASATGAINTISSAFQYPPYGGNSRYNVGLANGGSTINPNKSAQNIHTHRPLSEKIDPYKAKIQCVSASDANLKSQKTKEILRIQYLQNLYFRGNFNQSNNFSSQKFVNNTTFAPTPSFTSNINNSKNNLFNLTNSNPFFQQPAQPQQMGIFSQGNNFSQENNFNQGIFSQNARNNSMPANSNSIGVNFNNLSQPGFQLAPPLAVNPNYLFNTSQNYQNPNNLNSPIIQPLKNNFYMIYPNQEVSTNQFYNELLQHLEKQRTGYEEFFRVIHFMNTNSQQSYAFLKQFHPNLLLDLAHKYHYMMHLQAERKSEFDKYRSNPLNFIDARGNTAYFLDESSFNTFYDQYVQSKLGCLFKDDTEVKRILQTNPALAKKIIDRKNDIQTYLTKKTIDYLSEFKPQQYMGGRRPANQLTQRIESIYNIEPFRRSAANEQKGVFDYDWFRGEKKVQQVPSTRIRAEDTKLYVNSNGGWRKSATSNAFYYE